MGINRGKQFEEVVKNSIQKLSGISIDRLHDQTTGFLGSRNICDFIVYKYPYQYYIECKSTYGNTLPFSNITDTQWTGLFEKSKIPGVISGVLCWWVDRDITLFMPIEILHTLKDSGEKSVNLNKHRPGELGKTINGTKKRVFFDYDFSDFFLG